MAWAKVDDGWWAHPKVLGLSLEARGLWITALSWSCAQRRDTVPESLVVMVAGDRGVVLTAEIERAGLWVPVDDGDGWVIHDWAEYQELTLSEKRAEAGRKGGLRSGQTRTRKEPKPKQPEAKTRSKPEAKVEAGTHPDPPLPIPSIEPLPPVEVRDAEVVTIGRTRSDLDDLKDALVELFGEPPPQQWALYNRVATWIRNQGGTPDEIRYRAGRLAAEWGPKTATVTSLEKHWNRYAAEVGQVTDLDAEQFAEAQRKEKRRREAEAMTAELRGLPG